MPKLQDAQMLLAALGLPPAQQNELSALTLLALCNLKPDDGWHSAQSRSLTISKGIMAFIKDEYGRTYAPNTRETFRRQVLHYFVQARLADYNPDDPSLPTNSPKAHYAINQQGLVAIRAYGSNAWDKALELLYEQRQVSKMSPKDIPANLDYAVTVSLPDGQLIELSPGIHNQLEKLIIERFLPQFATGAEVLYLGDTANKDLFVARPRLEQLGIPIDQHGKLPDVILYSATNNWLYLIEAVTSHGPMTAKRISELNDFLSDSSTERIFVSAFPTLATFRKYLRDIAWETEVWIGESPDHLIHFNGDKFLGPRQWT